jgi:hypothetical protein
MTYKKEPSLLNGLNTAMTKQSDTNWFQLLCDWSDTYKPAPKSLSYYVDIQDRKTLIVSLGDSWTYGDSLDESERTRQIYGSLLSQHYDADIINVGYRGGPNSWILLAGNFIIDQLQKNNTYERVIVIVTMTESMRDTLLHQVFPFDYTKQGQIYGPTDAYYQHVLDSLENHWQQLAQNMLDKTDDRFVVVVAQNFVWHDMVNKLEHPRLIVPNQNWIEVLAQHQDIGVPIRTNVVTSWVLENFHGVTRQARMMDDTGWKKFTLPFIARAWHVTNWLETSQLNHKTGSKHPTQQGHQFWADYIIGHIAQFDVDNASPSNV